MMGPTEELAEFVAALRFDDLPAEVVTQACQVVLDAVGCAAAAWREDPRKARIAARLAEEFEAAEQATVIGAGRTHAALAALANGMLVNAADNDDTHKRALIHVGSVVVPAALAVSETRGLGGADLITAVVAGYEVAARVGMAVMPSHYRFWHSTATNGTFGAAAAAARANMYPKGDPRNPMSAAEIDAKFCDNATALVTAAEARALAEAIRALPTAASVRDLTRRVGRRPPGAAGGAHGMW